MLGRRVQSLNPTVQNLRELEAALHREWHNLPVPVILSLTGGMRRQVDAVVRARGGYTRY